jgi:hypothetical protein
VTLLFLAARSVFSFASWWWSALLSLTVIRRCFERPLARPHQETKSSVRFTFRSPLGPLADWVRLGLLSGGEVGFLLPHGVRFHHGWAAMPCISCTSCRRANLMAFQLAVSNPWQVIPPTKNKLLFAGRDEGVPLGFDMTLVGSDRGYQVHRFEIASTGGSMVRHLTRRKFSK